MMKLTELISVFLVLVVAADVLTEADVYNRFMFWMDGNVVMATERRRRRRRRRWRTYSGSGCSTGGS